MRRSLLGLSKGVDEVLDPGQGAVAVAHRLCLCREHAAVGGVRRRDAHLVLIDDGLVAPHTGVAAGAAGGREGENGRR